MARTVPMSSLPGYYQSEANQLMPEVRRAGSVHASGQYQGLVNPWVSEAEGLPARVPASQNPTTSNNPVGAEIGGYAAYAGTLQQQRQQGEELNFARPSGSLARVTSMRGGGLGAAPAPFGAVYRGRSLDPISVGRVHSGPLGPIDPAAYGSAAVAGFSGTSRLGGRGLGTRTWPVTGAVPGFVPRSPNTGAHPGMLRGTGAHPGMLRGGLGTRTWPVTGGGLGVHTWPVTGGLGGLGEIEVPGCECLYPMEDRSAAAAAQWDIEAEWMTAGIIFAGALDELGQNLMEGTEENCLFKCLIAHVGWRVQQAYPTKDSANAYLESMLESPAGQQIKSLWGDYGKGTWAYLLPAYVLAYWDLTGRTLSAIDVDDYYHLASLMDWSPSPDVLKFQQVPDIKSDAGLDPTIPLAEQDDMSAQFLAYDPVAAEIYADIPDQPGQPPAVVTPKQPTQPQQEEAWYENPVTLGVLAVGTIGVVYFATRKKKRR